MHRIKTNLNGRANGGFTLLEVLITMVIFAIGMLGIAGMQMAGMRHTHNSNMRSAAILQAEDLVERMRANQTGVNNGNYNLAAAMPTSFTPDCEAATCTPAQMATFDLVTWNTGNAALLPQGDGYVCLDATADGTGNSGNWPGSCDGTGDIYAIKIEWRERAITEDDVVDATETIRKNFVMRVKAW